MVRLPSQKTARVLGEWMTTGAGERLKQLCARTCAELRQCMPLLARRQHSRVPKGRVRVPKARKQVAAPDGTTKQFTVVVSRRIPLPQQLDTACCVRVGRHSICARPLRCRSAIGRPAASQDVCEDEEVSQSVSQLFHGPAPRSPLHRLAVRLRHEEVKSERRRDAGL